MKTSFSVSSRNQRLAPSILPVHPCTGLVSGWKLATMFGRLLRASAVLVASLALGACSKPVSERLGDDPERIRQAGIEANLAGTPGRAREAWAYGLALARKRQQARWSARFLIDLAGLEESLGNCKTAAYNAQAAREYARVAGSLPLQAEALNLRGLCAVRQGAYAHARSHLEQAHAFATKGDDSISLSNAERNLGLLAREQGEHDRALAHLERALELAHLSGHDVARAKALNNLGGVYRLRGQYTQALSHYRRALILRRAIGDRPGEIRTLGNLCLIYQNLGDMDGALEHCERSLDLARRLGDRRRMANGYSNTAQLYAARGRSEKSLDYLERSLAIKTAINDRAGAARAHNNIGNLHLSRGEYVEARESFERSLALKEALDDRTGQGATYLNLGLSYLRTGEPRTALEYLGLALAAQSEVQSPELTWRIHDATARTWTTLGNPRIATLFGKQAVNTIQRLRSGIRTLDSDLQTGFIKDKEAVYRRLAEALLAQGRLPEAQQVLAMLKEEEYFNFIRRDAGRDSRDTSAELSAVEADWVARYAEISDEIFALAQQHEALKQKAKSGTKLTGAEDERRLALRADLKVARQNLVAGIAKLEQDFERAQAESRDRLIARNLRSVESLKAVLGRLGAGVALVHYVMSKDRLHLLMTTSTTQVLRESPVDSATLQGRVQQFREALDSPSGDVVGAGGKLYADLIGPIESDLEQASIRTLMVSLDGSLRYVPLAALHDGERFVAERLSVVVFTEAGRNQLEVPSSEVWRVAGLGLSKQVEGFSPLPGVRAELDAIVRSEEDVNDDDGVLSGVFRMDEQFDARAISDLLDEGYPVLHIASHFVFKPGTERDSFLVLGTGEHLTLEQINVESFDLTEVDLLTLSACETAVGGAGEDGREVEGFAALAQNRGARGVLATLWPVADASTAAFMSEMYRLREEEGLDKAEAIRQTQLAFLRSDTAGTVGEAVRGAGLDLDEPGAFVHPYYWAPFVLMGNWL